MDNQHTTVGILSDSHGYLVPDIRTIVNQCDYIVHAGDISSAQVLEQLQPKKSLIVVAGNNDYPAAWRNEEATIADTLPDMAKLELPGGCLIVEHGHRLGNHPDHNQFRRDYSEARLIVYGHTHHRVIDQSSEPWVVNPGASGKTRTHGGPSCLILHASKLAWSIEEILVTDSAAA